MTFSLGNFRKEKINELEEDNNKIPFTLGTYFRVFKLSRVRLYLMSKKKRMSQEKKFDKMDDDFVSAVSGMTNSCTSLLTLMKILKMKLTCH